MPTRPRHGRTGVADAAIHRRLAGLTTHRAGGDPDAPPLVAGAADAAVWSRPLRPTARRAGEGLHHPAARPAARADAQRDEGRRRLDRAATGRAGERAAAPALVAPRAEPAPEVGPSLLAAAGAGRRCLPLPRGQAAPVAGRAEAALDGGLTRAAAGRAGEETGLRRHRAVGCAAACPCARAASPSRDRAPAGRRR